MKIPKWPFLMIIILLAAALGIYIIITPSEPAGCFKFDKGSTQNWTLDQLYDTNSKTLKKVTTLVPGNPPTYQTYTPFTLMNVQNIALEANTNLYLVSDQNVKSCDIYFVSPDLTKDKNWQNISGYSLDVRREFYSPCFDPPNTCFVQLQLKVIDTSDNSEHLFAETIGSSNNWKFHEIKLQKPYHFTWKPPFLKDKKYKVKQIRIRCTMPGWISKGECAYRGSWRIGNICPIK